MREVLEAHKDFPKTYYPLFMERLLETVRLKVGASLERSYEHLPVKTARRRCASCCVWGARAVGVSVGIAPWNWDRPWWRLLATQQYMPHSLV